MNEPAIATPLALPEYGAEIEGGFFAGIINLDGQQYGLAVAPKADGEHAGKWGAYGNKIPATDIADGHANTKAMAEAGSEIAQWALGLEINGRKDWYIPARDELELIYRNLKPTDQENWCSYRDGENPSSEPIGTFYEENTPGRTTAAAFQEGGAQAMDPAWYWSSTQRSAHDAYFQYFVDGLQYYYGKDLKDRARAVRRFIIHSSI